MLKQLSICAALIAFTAGAANAQQKEAILQKLEVPGAAFDIIIAMPKPQGMTFDLSESPDALLVHLIGGELALGFDNAEKMLKALELLAPADRRLSCGWPGPRITHPRRSLPRTNWRIAELVAMVVPSVTRTSGSATSTSSTWPTSPNGQDRKVGSEAGRVSCVPEGCRIAAACSRQGRRAGLFRLWPGTQLLTVSR